MKKMAVAVSLLCLSIIILSVTILPTLYFSDEIESNDDESNDDIIETENDIVEEEIEDEEETFSYLNNINILQSDITSKAVQYKITFTEQTMLSFDAYMSFTLTERLPVFYIIHFTDGKETHALHSSADGRGKIDFKILNRNIHLGKTDIERSNSLSKQIEIKKGSTWYLTVVVAQSIENEVVSVSLNTRIPCMVLELYEQTDDVYLFSTSHHQFDEQTVFKRGVIFNIFDGYKEFPVSKGGMICVDATNHMYGDIAVGNTLYSQRNYNKKQASVLWTTRYGLRPTTDLKYWYVRVNNIGLFSPSVLAVVVDLYFHSEYIFNDCKNKEDRPIENRLNAMSSNVKTRAEILKENSAQCIEEFVTKRTTLFAKRIGVVINATISLINLSASLLRFLCFALVRFGGGIIT